MLKLKENAVKTMAHALAKADGLQGPKISAKEEPAEIASVNQKLREAFGVSAKIRNAPGAPTKNAAAAPLKPAAKISAIISSRSKFDNIGPAENKSENSRKSPFGETTALPTASATPPTQATNDAKTPDPAQSEKIKLREIEEIRVAAEAKKLLEENQRKAQEKILQEEKLRRLEEQKKDEEEIKRLQEEAKRKEEEKKRQEEEKRLEEQKRAAETLRLQEAAKAAQEVEKRERERIAVQEKIKQEKIRIQAEKEQAREEKRRRLAILEKDLEEKIRKELEQKKQEAAARSQAQEKEKTSLKNDPAEKTSIDNLPAALETLVEKLAAKKNNFEKQLSGLPSMGTPLEQKKADLNGKISEIKSNELAAVETRENEIETLEAKERTKLSQKLTPEEKKAVEQKIWEIEEQRKGIEKQRWGIEDRIGEVGQEVAKIDSEIKQKENEIELVKQNIKKTAGQEKLVKFALEKGKLEEETLKDISEKDKLLPLLEAVNNKKNSTETILKELTKREISANADIAVIEQKEKQTIDPKEKRTVEQERWRISDTLKSNIELKWENEKKLEEINREVQSLQNKINAVNTKIDKVQSIISNSEIALEGEGFPVRKIRDSISGLLKENGIEIDPDILKDIIQEEDLPPVNNKPQSETKPVPETPPAPVVGKKIENTTPIKPEVTTKPVMEAAAPAPAKPKTIATSPEKTPDPEVIAVEDTIWKPETKLVEIAQTAKAIPQETTTAKVTPAKNNVDAAVEEPEKIPSYSEKIEPIPATNFRSFPQMNDPKTNIDRVITGKPSAIPPDSLQTPTGAKLENNLAAADSPLPNGLENRWDQIKKTTSPAAALKAAPPAATAKPLPAVRLKPKQKGNNKIFVRIMVILAIVAMLGIALVVLLTRNSSPAIIKSPETNGGAASNPGKTVPETGSDAGTTKKISGSSPLVVVSTITIYAEDLASVPNFIAPYLQTPLGSNGYYRISIQNKTDNTKVGLKQFFNIYKINAPQVFYSSVGDEFTIFIYSNNGRNRIGFIAPVTNADMLATTMQGWEGSAQQDTDNFFKLLGRKTQSPASSLKFDSNSAANGTAYRSMDFAPASDNFSIAYATYNKKYLIFTTSKDSLEKIFDQLQK
jgi:hypothetical protein